MFNLTIKGNFDDDYVESALKELDEKIKIPRNVEQILIIDNPKYYKVIEPHIPKEARKEFRKAYQEDPTSMSLTYDKFDLIIISVSLKEEAYLKHNKKAFIGLLAHELMHITQRRRHLDRSIRADAIKTFKKFEPKLRNLPISQPIIADFFASIGESANFTLKDIYDNFELINKGMGDYILEDYWNLYTKNKRFIKPIFYSDDDTAYKLIKNVKSAIDFELNLISAIVPFVRMARNGDKRAKKLVEYIADNYEVNINEVANAYDEVIQYAIKNFRWRSDFRQGFFRLVFKRALYLLSNLKIDEARHAHVVKPTHTETEIIIKKTKKKGVKVTRRRK
jgi:hypothetical protein